LFEFFKAIIKLRVSDLIQYKFLLKQYKKEKIRGYDNVINDEKLRFEQNSDHKYMYKSYQLSYNIID
jgi:hypothetical protein